MLFRCFSQIFFHALTSFSNGSHCSISSRQNERKKNQFCLTILILVVKGNFLSVTKYCRWKMFFSHTDVGPGNWTCDRKAGSCFCCVRHYWSSHPPTHPPTLRFQFCRLFKSNVQLCNFVSVPPYYGYVMCSFLRIWNKGQAAAVGLAWLPVAYEK